MTDHHAAARPTDLNRRSRPAAPVDDVRDGDSALDGDPALDERVLDVGALRVMRAIADHGSITAAAAALGSSQPAVSQLVRRLERRLGTALLDRSGRSVRLTEAGGVLAHHGGAVVTAVRAAAAEVTSLTTLRSGRVRLAAFPSASATLVPRALADLRRDRPGLVVTLDEAEPPQAFEQLRAGSCDVAVVFDYPGTAVGVSEHELDGLVSRPLIEEPTAVALPADHPAAQAQSERRGLPADDGLLDLRDLADEDWIAGCPRCRGHLLAASRERGFTPEIAFATDDYVAVLGLVAAGLGVALLPGLVHPVALRTPGVVLRRAAGTLQRSIYAVTTPDLARVPAVRATLDALEVAALAHG